MVGVEWWCEIVSSIPRQAVSNNIFRSTYGRLFPITLEDDSAENIRMVLSTRRWVPGNQFQGVIWKIKGLGILTCHMNNR